MPDADLDATFAALAHPVRRDILVRLRRGPARVGGLAAPYRLALPSISRHLDVLEAAGLIARSAEGRERICTLRTGALEHALTWLGEHRRFWDETLGSLAVHLSGHGAGARRPRRSRGARRKEAKRG